MAHSELQSPSASHLWLECTSMPQALIDNNVPNVSSVAAERGTLQHDAAEARKKDGVDICPGVLDSDEWDQVVVATDSIDKFLKEDGSGLRPKGKAQGYRDYYELEVSFDDWRKDCFGTADFVRIDISNRTLYVLDYKFGRIAVSSKMNSQLLIYALATLATFLKQGVDISKLVDEAVIGIAQPKVSKNLDFYRLTIDELLTWDRETLQPAQRAILEGNTKFSPGPHCVAHYCKFRAGCTAAKEKMEGDMDTFMEMYSPHGLKEEWKVKDDSKPGGMKELSPEALSQFLLNATLVEGLIKDARAIAEERITNGLVIPMFKMVYGQGKRVWTDEAEGEKFLKGRLKAEERTITKNLTAPQAETALTKAGKLEHPRTKNAFDALVVYEKGSPKLVHESDPRSAITKEVSQEEVDQTIDDMFSDFDMTIDEALTHIDSGISETVNNPDLGLDEEEEFIDLDDLIEVTDEEPDELDDILEGL